MDERGVLGAGEEGKRNASDALMLFKRQVYSNW